MTEAGIERSCCLLAKRWGWLALKLWPLITGLPDRLFLIPGGRVWFVEFKTPSGVVSKRQQHVHGLLGRLGFPVTVVRSRDAFEMLAKENLLL